MSQGGILRSAGQVAVGTLISRVTGFIRTLALAALLGKTLTNDAYNIANTLPNQVFELLLGGVLTSVIVPLLVRAEKDAELRGRDINEYPQRLFTIAVAGLGAATLLGMLASGLLVAMMGIGFDDPNFSTATLMAILLLPQIIFYGIGALAGAVLNTREAYRAPAWAPVLNNLVVTVVAGTLIVLYDGTGEFSRSEIILLCLGTTAGIVAQALILIPAWRKAGFTWKWRWGVRGLGLGELRTLALWLLGYVLIGQVGFIVATNVATAASDFDQGRVSQWVYAALLFQLPYGILGVSLLTAIMPKMSRAARDGDWRSVKGYLANGTRLSGLGMIPVSVAFWVLAVPLAVLFFDNLNFEGPDARYTGLILAASSFGLLPYAVTLLQLRVFFAAKDAKTPTYIMGAIVAIRIALSLLCLTLDPDLIVIGLAVANSISFLVGAVIGDVVLRREFGHLGTAAVLRDLARQAIAALAALAVMIPVYLGLQDLFSGASVWSWDGLSGLGLLEMSKWQIAIVLACSSAVGLAGYVGAAVFTGVPEMRSIVRRLKRGGSATPPAAGPGAGAGAGSAPSAPGGLSREAGEVSREAGAAPSRPSDDTIELSAILPTSQGQYGAALGARQAPPLDLDALVPTPPPPGASGVRSVRFAEETRPPPMVHSMAHAPRPTSRPNDTFEDDVATKRHRSKWALLGLTCLGLVIAVVAGWLTGMLVGKIFGPDDENNASPSTTSAAPTTPSEGGSGTGQTLNIAGASLFDPPPGDGAENPDRINLSYDGQPGTTWPTLQYQDSPQFGNIKPGVGIVYDLGEEKTLSMVQLQTTIPGTTVEIRVANAEGSVIEDYAVVAGATLEASSSIPIPEGTKAQYVLVWFTSLVQQSGGYYQGSLSEVTIIG